MQTQRDICEKLLFGVHTSILKKAAGEYCGILPFYTTFSNQTFARMVCTFFFEFNLIYLGYFHYFSIFTINYIIAYSRCLPERENENKGPL